MIQKDWADLFVTLTPPLSAILIALSAYLGIRFKATLDRSVESHKQLLGLQISKVSSLISVQSKLYGLAHLGFQLRAAAVGKIQIDNPEGVARAKEDYYSLSSQITLKVEEICSASSLYTDPIIGRAGGPLLLSSALFLWGLRFLHIAGSVETSNLQIINAVEEVTGYIQEIVTLEETSLERLASKGSSKNPPKPPQKPFPSIDTVLKGLVDENATEEGHKPLANNPKVV